MSKLLDRISAFAATHERPIAIVGGIWFVVSWANYAQFIDLPQIPFITDQMAIYVSTAVNAGWWAFLHPAIERRKKASVVESSSNG